MVNNQSNHSGGRRLAFCVKIAREQPDELKLEAFDGIWHCGSHSCFVPLFMLPICTLVCVRRGVGQRYRFAVILYQLLGLALLEVSRPRQKGTTMTENGRAFVRCTYRTYLQMISLWSKRSRKQLVSDYIDRHEI